ncbi:MAG: SwmB domain-containing protein, partial [Acidobacteriota bacterium]|nr:SwmB domain-containing protein [Acidobacteriota bacterium]
IRDRAGNAAVLTHPAVTTQSGHRVDGVKPELVETDGAVVDGATLTLTYSELLDGSSTPPASAFSVSGGGATRTVSDVALAGEVVTLVLDPAVEHGQTGIRLSYRVPTRAGENPLRDLVGNRAARLSTVAVANRTPDTTPPEVSGVEITSNAGSDRTYAADDEIRVTVTFNETVEVTGTPRLSLELGGGSRSADYEGGTGTSLLVFAYEVAAGESDTDGVGVAADSLSGGTIEDTSDNPAELAHDGLEADANHKVDGVKPDLASTDGAVVNGTTLTLTYDEPLDRGSTPATGDFTVSGGDQTRTVSRVSVSGSTVALTLSAGAEHEETGIQVSYTPGTNRIRDVPGNEAEALSRRSVPNETPDTTPPEVRGLAISSNPGSHQTYAAGDDIEVTVTFSETVKVTGRPQLTLRVGTRNRRAGYESGTDTTALVFAYEVADGDEDTDGVAIGAGRIALNGGTIKDEAGNAAVLAYRAVQVRSGQRVDGVRPEFVSAAVDGASLTLTFREALDEGSRPAPGAFTVTVGGAGRTVSGVSIGGSVVTLTLSQALEHGDTGIRVSYAPGTTPIRDAVGNEARGLSNRPVTNTTDAPNTAPEITTRGPLSVGENRSLVRRLAGRDTDAGDEVTGWAIVGGADQGQFSITSDTGELSFRTAPDYEDPLDVASTDPVSEAADNRYVVTVEVRSGAGAREMEAEQTFMVRVTDEREAPEAPEAPVISGETADSLTVSWSEPDNRGPAIADYDLQYREKGRGGFRDGGHDGPELSATLSDLESGTEYEVQVRARNEEGTSDWSESGEGMTIAPLTVEMMAVDEPPVSGTFMVRISFSEPVAGFGTGDIEASRNPECRDDQNNTVFCDPVIGGLQTADDRVYTAAVTPVTSQVAHSYALTLTVEAGSVSSLLGSKPNEEPDEPLAVRVSPPGAPEPISTLSLAAHGSNASVRLSWSRPSDNGGSAIIRYEYRFQAVGDAWSEWGSVGGGSSGVTVAGLINGREYIFEVRAVNALGKGEVETAMATPEFRNPPPPGSGGGGGGGGGGFVFPPQAPVDLVVLAGDRMVRLEWSPPENDGGTPILRYEYRLKPFRGEFGEWTPIPDSAPDEVNASSHTVLGLDNGTIYVFELRAVNLVDEGPETEAVEVMMPLDGAFWSNFLGEDLEGGEASLEWTPFGGSPRSLRLRFGGERRFEEDELDGAGEVVETRVGGYGYRYTGQRTGELRLDYDGGESCELRMSYGG